MTIISVKIKEIHQETPTVRTITLDTQGQPFNFYPGQWIDCYADIDGKREIVGYSMASAPTTKGTFQLAIKQSDNPVTTYIHTNAKKGDTLYVEGGQGKIYYTDEMSKNVILLSAGIGVAPMMSILRYINDSQRDVTATFVQSASIKDELIFHIELLETEKRNPQIEYIFTLTRETLPEVRSGKIDEGLLMSLNLDEDPLFFICGPSQMIESSVQILKDLGVSESRMKYELWW